MNNENIKRFVDTFPFSFVDDAEFESKHKRDKEGKFAKTTAGGNESEEKDFSKSVRKTTLSSYLDRIDSELPEDVFKDFFKKEMQGKSIRCTIEDLGEMDITFGSNFLGETVAKFKQNNGLSKTKLARRMLIAMNQSDKVLKEGRRTKWESSYKAKHKDDKFSRHYLRMEDLNGEKFLTAFTVKRHLKQHPVPQQLAVQGSKHFRKTFNRQQFEKKKIKDGQEYVVEIVAVNIFQA